MTPWQGHLITYLRGPVVLRLRLGGHRKHTAGCQLHKIGVEVDVGSQIVNESLTRGHHVTGASRKRGDVAGTQSGSADLANTTTFGDSESHAAVVLATGLSRTGGDHGEWLSAMMAVDTGAGDTRLLIVGGAGALSVDGVPLVDTPGVPETYKAEACPRARYEADCPASATISTQD